MSHTDAKDPKSPRTLTDAEIVSERFVRRRSFLSRTGLLMGGALAVAAGMRSGAVKAADPDKDGDDPAPDKAPDRDKASDPDKTKKHKHKLKSADPDARKSTDPDANRSTDLDARRAPPPPDPHKAPDSTKS